MNNHKMPQEELYEAMTELAQELGVEVSKVERLALAILDFAHVAATTKGNQ